MASAPPFTGLRAWSAATGIGVRRQLLSALAAGAVLTLLTVVLDHDRDAVGLTIVFLLYLAVVVVTSAVGGSIVGTATAVIAFLVVNFFFTDPRHTLNVSDPDRLAELIIFLAVAGTVAALGDTANRRREVIDLQTLETAELSAANELRTSLLRAVSHDLRTPLTTAKLATSSLRAADVELGVEERRELLQLADEQIDRLIAIVENLLDAGRLQAGVLNVEIHPVDVVGVVERLVASMPHELAGSIGVHAPDGLPEAATDAALLERVLANLVTNAQHAEPDGPVTLEVECIDDQIVVSVIDHGPGLPAHELADAVRPFHRFEDRGGGGGVGLGLPICLGFCEAMGATLEFHETPGGGLSVLVRLPVARDERATHEGGNG